MNSILSNHNATQDFLLIIAAYGGFLALRDQQKKMDFSRHLEDLNTKYYHCTMPITGWHYDESTYDSFVPNSDVRGLLSDIDKKFETIKEEFIQKLISSEKYYRKLKHQFKEKYPELSNDLDLLISQHHKSYANKKCAEQKITQLSYRFLGFANQAFYVSHSGYGNFFKAIIRKYNINVDEKNIDKITDKIENIYENFGRRPSYKKIAELKAKNALTEQEIHFLAKILKQVIDVVSFDDLHNVESYKKYLADPANAYNPEKIAVCYAIVNKKFRKYTNLLVAYENFQKI